MKHVFLVLAILGAIVPYIFFLSFFADSGIVLTTFVTALFANGAAGGFTADLLISSLAFWLFLFARRAPRIWLYVLVNLTIGLSCALPLYFYVLVKEDDATQSV